jgi:hypothetical protein
MQQDIERFLNLRHLPASCTAAQAAGFLGISPHEVPILLARGLLKPLGHPAQNAPKSFLTAKLKELAVDEKWFGKAKDAISEHWHYKNTRKKRGVGGSEKTSAEEVANAD